MQEMMGYTEGYACGKRDFQVIGYRLKNLKDMTVSQSCTDVPCEEH